MNNPSYNDAADAHHIAGLPSIAQTVQHQHPALSNSHVGLGAPGGASPFGIAVANTASHIATLATRPAGPAVPMAMPMPPTTYLVPVESANEGYPGSNWLDSLLAPEQGQKPKRLRSANWSVEEELILIQAYKELEAKHEMRKALWESLSTALLEKGYDRKAISLEQKWGNLLQSFRKIEEYNKGPGANFYELEANDRKILYHSWKVNSLDPKTYAAMEEVLADKGTVRREADRRAQAEQAGGHISHGQDPGINSTPGLSPPLPSTEQPRQATSQLTSTLQAMAANAGLPTAIVPVNSNSMPSSSSKHVKHSWQQPAAQSTGDAPSKMLMTSIARTLLYKMSEAERLLSETPTQDPEKCKAYVTLITDCMNLLPKLKP